MRKFFCCQFYALIIIVHLIHLSSCLFPRTEYLPMLVEQRADVSRRLCSCIDVEQVKEKPSRGGGYLEVGSGRFQLTINCKREGRVRLHNNQPDDDDDNDNDNDKNKDKEDDGQQIRQQQSQRPQFLTQQPTF